MLDNLPAGNMYGDGSGITLFQFFYQPSFYSYIRLAFTVRYLANPADTELTVGEFYYCLYGFSVVEPMTARHIVQAPDAGPVTTEGPALKLMLTVLDPMLTTTFRHHNGFTDSITEMVSGIIRGHVVDENLSMGRLVIIHMHTPTPRIQKTNTS